MTATAEKLYVVDGRHRLWAARAVGVPEMRVDVHHPGGFGLRVVSIDDLRVDPDVQFEDTFKLTHARRIAREWDPEKVGVLLAVTPDVPVARKADIKMGRDGVRRNVGTVERFRARVAQGDPVATRIEEIARRHGWTIANNRREHGALIGVVTVERIYRQMGDEGFDRVLRLADHWRGEAMSGSSVWIGGLGVFVAEGYDDAMTDDQRTRLNEVVPAVVIRKAVGNVAARTGTINHAGNATTAGMQAREVVDVLRKTLRLRKRVAA